MKYEDEYKLAKELKDAGFPEPKGVCFNPVFGVYGHWNKDVYVPALRELTYACGDDFGALMRISDNSWQAMGGAIMKSEKYDMQGEWTRKCLGATPEEAVARLWLALNKKA